jgi:catechol 2,3-dioxygenase-like lactoylglutathione lyase family enzyme
LLILVGFPPPVAAQTTTGPLVEAVESVGMTVRDMDAAVAFYRDVLTFAKVSDVEVSGEEFERLAGVFGLRARVVRLRLGDESLDLTEYLAPRGRPYPVASRSNDRWFQHAAIVVRDMDAAYARLRRHKVEHASSGPQRLPDWNPTAGGIRALARSWPGVTWPSPQGWLGGPVPALADQQLQLAVQRINQCLTQRAAADRGAMNGGQVRVVGLDAGIDTLAKLLGRKRTDQADVGAPGGEVPLWHLVIAARPLDGDD